MVFETPPVFHWFFANVNTRSPLAGIIRVFGHVGCDLPETHTQPATYCALCSTKVEGSEKSRMRTTYQKNSMRFRVFRACTFLAKNPISYGFFWQCKWCNNKKQVFYTLVFANVNGPSEGAHTKREVTYSTIRPIFSPSCGSSTKGSVTVLVLKRWQNKT